VIAAASPSGSCLPADQATFLPVNGGRVA